MKGLGGRNDGRVGREHEMNARVGDQVCLKFRDIDIQGTVKTQGRRQGRNDLGNQAIKIGVSRALNVEVALADIIQGFIVEAKGTIRVLEESMSGKYRVVRFHDGRRDSGRGRHGKGKLGFAAVIDTQTFEQERAETRAGTTTRRVKDEESLQAGAIIRQLADAIQDEIDNFLAGRVVSAGVIVGGIFLAVDDLFGMVQILVGATANFVTHGGFQIDIDGAGDVLSRRRFTKKGVEGIVGNPQGLVRGHGTIGQNAVFQTVEFPALVPRLDTSLTQMNRDTFTHDER
mmetsp:Transcript_3385/g.6783  ORF Transcript_3385/g.6783 Transcript_3385/m.6783 type:complete len:287 (+) Transcript_3385:607-1467(+)